MLAHAGAERVRHFFEPHALYDALRGAGGGHGAVVSAPGDWAEAVCAAGEGGRALPVAGAVSAGAVLHVQHAGDRRGHAGQRSDGQRRGTGADFDDGGGFGLRKQRQSEGVGVFG